MEDADFKAATATWSQFRPATVVFKEATDAWSQFHLMAEDCKGATDVWSRSRVVDEVFKVVMGVWPRFRPAAGAFKVAMDVWWQFQAVAEDSKGLMGEWLPFILESEACPTLKDGCAINNTVRCFRADYLSNANFVGTATQKPTEEAPSIIAVAIDRGSARKVARTKPLRPPQL